MTQREGRGLALRHVGAVAAFLVGISALRAQEAGRDDGFPFLTACVTAPYPEGNTANKGIVIRVGPDAAVCFDTDLLRMSAGWTSAPNWEERLARVNGEVRSSFAGWAERILHLNGVTFSGGHGGHPSVIGNQTFGTRAVPGWSGGNADFSDPRPEPYGPIPEDWGRYDGLHVVGSDVVLAYTVLGTTVHEQPGIVEKDGRTAFVRSFRLGPVREPLTLRVCDLGVSGTGSGSSLTLSTGPGDATRVQAVGLPDGARLERADDVVLLRLPASDSGVVFKLVLWSGDGRDAGAVEELAAGEPWVAEPGPAGPHWPEEVVTRGVLEASRTPDGAYVLDRLTPPDPNPWGRRVRFGGLGFFSDGTRAALSTWDGDVWIVSGIDEDLDELRWKRFASGGFETLGLVIVDDVIYTSGRDQITRYHDTDGDGEADFYENFNNQVTSSPGFHEFQFDLHVDADGNFYSAKAGPVRGGGRGFGGGGGNGEISRSAGTVQKISPDGKRREIVATGFRAPNGIGVGPDGRITTGDNEGTWIPACPLNWVEPGGFYGVENLAHRDPVPTFDRPLCWLSKGEFDNSGGGQVWVTSDRWGPFGGELLHMSYGQCALYLVMKQQVGDQMQGGVVRIPLDFTSSAMRARFNPADGQLYVAGLRGWQTRAARLTGLDRVRYTGEPVYSVRDLKVDRDGLHLTFTQPLDPVEATDVENYSAEMWNYRRTSDYGSPEFSVKNPDERGRDPVGIESATLSADGRTVTLRIPDLQPVHQLQLQYLLYSADDVRIKQDILTTIHYVP